MKKRSMGFTFIEIMMVIAVIGILAIVTVPKYQALMDHYRLESSAQKVAMQLRHAKQYAMDHRDNVDVMLAPTLIYISLKASASDPLEEPEAFDSGISVDFSNCQGLKDITPTLPSNPPYEKYLEFDRKGFLVPADPSDPSVKIVLTNNRTPSQTVSVNLSTQKLDVKINWN